jgi:hypothetical protein
MYVIADLKSCVNYVELETRTAMARLFPRWEVTEESKMFRVKIGLLISIDQRHETRIDRRSCLFLIVTVEAACTEDKRMVLEYTHGLFIT